MPSFDVVSEVDMHEVGNAVDQTSREIGTRFDFKGSNVSVELSGTTITLQAENDFQLKQMLDILEAKMIKRKVDTGSLERGKVEESGARAHQDVEVRQGIDKDLARKIVKRVKDAKLKVQAAIQGDQVRVTGKKRDDLQTVMGLLREAKLPLPLQFINFRD